MKKVLLEGRQIAQALERLYQDIVRDIPAQTDLAIIGLRSRGEILAQRLGKKLAAHFQRDIPIGTLDITLYRDDIHSPRRNAPLTVGTTEISFDINDKTILLVDDVLHTGRSVRAAMDALTDLGRPKAIRLAVLVDRGQRELPIRADYVGIRADVQPNEQVAVLLMEEDGQEQVVVETANRTE